MPTTMPLIVKARALGIPRRRISILAAVRRLREARLRPSRSRLLFPVKMRRTLPSRTTGLGEETLPDYTRVINITPHARPFFEALARVDEGLKAE
jgi:hypothetical protein